MRSDLANTSKKVDAHAVSVKYLELQMAQLSTTLNTRLPCTLSRNTIQNLKNDAYCIEITTREFKQTIDPHMPFVMRMCAYDLCYFSQIMLTGKTIAMLQIRILINRPPKIDHNVKGTFWA